MLPLSKKELKLHQKATTQYIYKKKSKKFTKDKKYQKVRDHPYFTSKNRGAAHTVCNLRFNVSNEILVAFHNESNYDYHFVIKELANEFEGQFVCLREKTEEKSRQLLLF